MATAAQSPEWERLKDDEEGCRRSFNLGFPVEERARDTLTGSVPVTRARRTRRVPWATT